MRIGKELRKILETNPWVAVADQWLKDVQKGNQIKKWVHSEDVDVVTNLNAKFKRDPFKLHLELPPCPYIGHPSAKIWYLLKNPGYNEVDVYDQADVKMGRRLLKGRKKLLSARDDEFAALKSRQKAILQALKFDLDFDGCFYVLSSEFKTFMQSKGRRLGAYNWYMANCFPNEGGFFGRMDESLKLKCASRNIFDLEYSPYHSMAFSGFEDHKKFRHHEFWKLLVKYALKNGKILIVRGYYLCEEIRSVAPRLFYAACLAGRIYVCSSRKARIARANLLMPSPSKNCSLSKYCEGVI